MTEHVRHALVPGGDLVRGDTRRRNRPRRSCGRVIECGCWAHTRRYFFKALSSDAVRANHALELIRKLFALERAWATAPPEARLAQRQAEAKPLVDEFFAWCNGEALKVLDETPISKASQYARNPCEALQQFLTDSRVPIDNNISERALRRQAVGRKNWLFVGGDDGGGVNATLVSQLASCQMHGIEPYAYLRDLLCLVPSWPQTRVLELAPANWKATSARADVVAELEGNEARQRRPLPLDASRARVQRRLRVIISRESGVGLTRFGGQ